MKVAKMFRFAELVLALFLGLAAAGCGGSSEAVTDPSKVPPLTEEQKQEVKAADASVADEENANPTMPTRGGAGKK